jgi:hypothetical protein
VFNLLQVINLGHRAPTAPAGLLGMLNDIGPRLPLVRAARAGLTLPRALNGGQLMWRLSFASEQDCWSCLESQTWCTSIAPVLSTESGANVDRVQYSMDFCDVSRGRNRNGIWRCLVLAVDPCADIRDVRQLERDLMLMPAHVASIRNWALGRARCSQGRRRWSHVWEQEFDSVEDLEGEYMANPIHWGLVDRWFDPECPERIVDPHLIHAAFAIDTAVIA